LIVRGFGPGKLCFAGGVTDTKIGHMAPDSLPQCEFESDKLAVRLRFSGPADVATITPVVSWVMDFVKEMGCAVGKEWEVEIALREALANAMVHGSKRDPSKKVEFCVAIDNDRGLLIVVIQEPVVGQNLYSDHGRGIFLINQLMDEVKFERGGTEIRMRKR
jgi:serine/threonine-protein kinase RsbW